MVGPDVVCLASEMAPWIEARSLKVNADYF